MGGRPNCFAHQWEDPFWKITKDSLGPLSWTQAGLDRQPSPTAWQRLDEIWPTINKLERLIG